MAHPKAIGKAVALIITVLSLVGCRSSRPMVATATHFVDVNKKVAVADTLIIHDSVFVHEYTVKGTDTDTVFIKEYRTRYSQKAQAVHDTVTVTVRNSVPVLTAASTANTGASTHKRYLYAAIAAILINGAIIIVLKKI